MELDNDKGFINNDKILNLHGYKLDILNSILTKGAVKDLKLIKSQ